MNESLSDYDYDLPESRIAQTPLEDRSASRLLHLCRGSGAFYHRPFRDVTDLLRSGDLLVMNDTRVSAVRLFGRKSTGAEVEALLLQEVAPRRYEAMVRPAKRLRIGATMEFPEGLRAHVGEELPDGRRILEFEPLPDFDERLSEVGLAPLPPYIHEHLADRERYQTVYARNPGSAAAPTAGLHFTPEILASLAATGVRVAYVTLDVGLDTFRPITEADPSRHPIHGEVCAVSPETADAVASAKGRILAVGTTSVRTLETFAIGQRKVASGRTVSRLFIRPGYEFHIVDGMFTNFHMPRTTMLMMLAALVGREALMAAYAEAVKEQYRFLSFGDSMFLSECP